MKYIKKLFIVLFAVFIAGFIYVLLNLNGITTYKKEDYVRLADSTDFLPDIDYFDSASDIDFFRFRKYFLGFSSEAYILTAEYNSDIYFYEKEIFENHIRRWMKMFNNAELRQQLYHRPNLHSYRKEHRGNWQWSVNSVLISNRITEKVRW